MRPPPKGRKSQITTNNDKEVAVDLNYIIPLVLLVILVIVLMQFL